MITEDTLRQADAELAATYRKALAAYVKELYPRLAVAGGPASDLVLAPSAAALAAVDAAAEAAAGAADLEAALADGAAPADLTAQLAARGVVPLSAQRATGTAAAVVGADNGFTLSGAVVFQTVDGVEFTPDRGYRFLPSGTGATGTPGDVVLTETPEGTFYGEFGVRAVETGSGGNRTAGASLTPEDDVTDDSSFYLASDSTGGREDETAAEVLARLPAADAPATAASDAGIERLVGEVAPGAAVRVVGYGDAGAVRGMSALGVYLPGRVDARVRDQGPLGVAHATVTATLVGNAGGFTRWQAVVGPGDGVEGAAYPDAVYPAGGQFGDATYVPTVTSRGYDGVPDWIDVASGSDAAGSAYATVTFRFVDGDTPISGLTIGVSTAEYTVRVRYFPKVAEADEALTADSVRPAGGDALARGPTPVKVLATVTVVTPSPDDVDEDGVAAAYAAGVNATGITSVLTAGAVLAAAQSALPTGAAVRTTSMSGTLHKADGTLVTLSGTDSLTATTDYPNGVGPDTVAFYCDPEDVTVAVTST